MSHLDPKATKTVPGVVTVSGAGCEVQSTNQKGLPNGYAPLDSNGIVPAAHLPSQRKFTQPLAGAVDGVNKVFITSEAFFHTTDFPERVILRGLAREEGAGSDYIASESGGAGTGYDTITLVKAPKVGDNIYIDYYPDI